MAATGSAEQSAFRVCDYLAIELPEVMARLSSPSIDAELGWALRDALEVADAEVTVRSTPPKHVPGGSVRMHVVWSASTPSSQTLEGTATIVVLAVQTGPEIVTELLVEVVVTRGVTESAAAVTTRFLAQLVARFTTES